MAAAALHDLKHDLLERVGELAAGWNAGQNQPGVKLPAWVVCHGSTRNSAAVLNTFHVLRIILLTTEVSDRRIQSAVSIKGKKMRRRAKILLKRALRRAGWR